MKNMNTPNKLTILRVILVPFFIVTLLYWNRYVALALFIAASLTDWFDGRIARKHDLVTNFGKFLDPLADKLLVTSALICFVQTGQIPAWVAVIVVGRDLAVDGLRMMAASQNIVLAAGWSGKIKTAFTMPAICIMITPLGNISLGGITLNTVFAAIILILNIVSMADYFIHNGKILLEQK